VAIDVVIQQVEESLEPSAYRKLREVVADAYSFIRSMDANQAFATVTLEELMGDQIKRNGEGALSNASQFNPYSYNTQTGLPAGLEPGERANFLGAADGGAPTKFDRILAIKNNLVDTINDIKTIPLIEVADTPAYTDVNSVAE
jgi:hypothetical protein